MKAIIFSTFLLVIANTAYSKKASSAKTLSKTIAWQGLQIKIDEIRDTNEYAGGNCKVEVFKGKKSLASDSFERISAAGGGVEVCGYDPSSKDYFHVSMTGDGTGKSIYITKSGILWSLIPGTDLYKISGLKQLISIRTSESEDHSIGTFDPKANKTHPFPASVLDPWAKSWPAYETKYKAFLNNTLLYIEQEKTGKVFEFDLSKRTGKPSTRPDDVIHQLQSILPKSIGLVYLR